MFGWRQRIGGRRFLLLPDLSPPSSPSSRSARRGARAGSPPMLGKVLKVLVAEGQRVEHGEALIVLEAMKMETTLYAESAAVVARICVAPGQMVDHGTRLIELSPPGSAATPPESPPQDD